MAVFTLQFQYRGDSQKGPVVSPQEAQAQAILQQAQVGTGVTSSIHMSLFSLIQRQPFLPYLKKKNFCCIKGTFFVLFFFFSLVLHEGTSRSIGSHRSARPSGESLLSLPKTEHTPLTILVLNFNNASTDIEHLE